MFLKRFNEIFNFFLRK